MPLLPALPSSCGHLAVRRSLSASASEKKLAESWMSSTPGSQYSISTFTLRMLMSPRPPRSIGSQNTPFTPVPVLSLRHQVSL